MYGLERTFDEPFTKVLVLVELDGMTPCTCGQILAIQPTYCGREQGCNGALQLRIA